MELSNLAGKLRKYGLSVVVVGGFEVRGYAGQDMSDCRGVLWHHTATNRSRFLDADAPTLAMCVDGRSDLAGPLCNIVLGRSGVVYLVAAGLANHAGAGSAPNIPRDYGNYFLIGIEMESSGVAPYDWTPDQLRVAPYLGAALELECLGRLPEDLRLQLGHLEYSSTGKIDPAGWPGGMDGLRASINAKLAELAGGIRIEPAGEIVTEYNEEDLFMALSEQQQKDIYWLLCTTEGQNHLAGIIARGVLNYEVPWYGNDGVIPPEGQRRTVNLTAVAGWIDTMFGGTNRLVGEVKQEVADLADRPAAAAVELKPEDVAALAEQLKGALAPGLAADLARRLAE